MEKPNLQNNNVNSNYYGSDNPDHYGFIPPWAEWSFNEWETCTDTDLHVVSSDTSDKITSLSPEEAAAKKTETEKKIRLQLEFARLKPVAFAVRTNVSFDGTTADDSPIKDKAVSFKARDYLHIKEKFDDDWWIGRVVIENGDVGYIPSPAKLETFRSNQNNQVQGKQCKTNNKMTTSSNVDNLLHSKSQTNSNYIQDSGDVDSADEADNYASPRYSLPNRETPTITNANATNATNKDKKKNYFKKMEFIPPYEVVPSMRPVVFIGPSLKGLPVTDLLQKALFDFLKHRFENRIHITRVTADISMAKRSILNNPNKQALLEKSNNRTASIVEIKGEVERIFELARNLKLVILDCDTVNHPSQLSKTSLSPIQVFIKISSSKVLQKLIKLRGKSTRNSMNVQMVASEKLNQCTPDQFDLIIEETQLDEASDHLADYLENYWKAANPPIIIQPQPTPLSPPTIKLPQLEPRGSAIRENTRERLVSRHSSMLRKEGISRRESTRPMIK